MDEPLSNLDAKMRAELQQLQDALSVTTVYVPHDQTETMTMGDRLAIMNDGKPAVGYAGRVLPRADQQVRRGIPRRAVDNFFPISEHDGSLIDDSIRCRLPDGVLDGHDALKLELGIRPEEIQIVDGDDRTTGFTATVEVVEQMGEEQDLHLTTDDDPPSVAIATERQLGQETWEVTVRFPDRQHSPLRHTDGKQPTQPVPDHGLTASVNNKKMETL